MAKLGSGIAQSANNENPIDVFLENRKGELVVWNKEEGKNDVHTLDKFIILTVGFTIKGQVWNDSIQKYTNTYFSNEIRQFNETIYAIDMTFNPTNKRLVAKGKWKTDVKPYMPQGIGIKTGITVLDLNDGLVKEFFISASDYFGGLNNIIFNNEPDTIYSYSIDKLFTKGTKDKLGNEILMTEKELDKLSRDQLVGIKNRYKSNLQPVGKADSDQITKAEEILDTLEDNYQEKRKYYEKQYGEVQGEENVYAQPIEVQEVELDKEIQGAKEITGIKEENKKEIKEDSISISDIPF